MNNIIVFIFLVPLITFCISLIFISSLKFQKIISLIMSGVYLGFTLELINRVLTNGSLSLASGGWLAPYGITLTVDILSATMLLATGIVYFAGMIYSEPGKTCEDSPYYFPLLNMLFVGISGAFIAADLFNLYVWFEITLLSSFVLMGLRSTKQRLGGNLKYIVLNLISSLLFLLGVGLVYSATGELSFSELIVELSAIQKVNPEYLLAMNLILFCAFAIKSGLFPFYQWLGASYPQVSPALSGIFAGMLTKVGLYAIFRVNGLLFPVDQYFVLIVAIIPALTMVTGVIKAIGQNQMRRILSFHIVSQVGYIAVASFALTSPDMETKKLALIAGFFYAVHHIIVKANLFFVAGIVKYSYGSDDINEVSHVRHSSPLLAILFAIPALSLVGIPPSSGFWAKLSLFQLILPLENYFIIACMLIAGFFTLFSMIKIWIGVFWGDGTEIPVRKNELPKYPLMACGFLCLISLVLAFAPEVLLSIIKMGIERLAL